MNIRYATMADLDDIASVESECFPVLEAATKEEFEQRIKYFGNHFWLMFDEGITDKSTHGNVLWHQMRLDFKLRNNGVNLSDNKNVTANKKFAADRILSYFKEEWKVLLIITVSGLIYNFGLLFGPWFCFWYLFWQDASVRN